MSKEKCCRTCKWHHRIEDVSSRGRKVIVWECDNLESDNYADFTDCKYCCEDWEERECGKGQIMISYDAMNEKRGEEK